MLQQLLMSFYFRLKEAIDYLLRRDDIIQNGVGVIGVSKGGDIALMMATHNPKVS